MDSCFPEKQRKTHIFRQPLHLGSNRPLYMQYFNTCLFLQQIMECQNSSFSMSSSREKYFTTANHLPSTYQEAVNIIKPLLVPIEKYKCCINDCKMFPMNSKISTCPVDDENLMSTSNRCKKNFALYPHCSKDCTLVWYEEAAAIKWSLLGQ